MPQPIIHTNGYVTIWMPTHRLAMANGYVYEHRMVLEQKLGRELLNGEQCHHIDGNRTNNDPSNLEVVGIREHASNHNRKRTDLRGMSERNQTVKCECGCGGSFLKYDTEGRPRKYINGHNRNSANSPKV